MRVGVPGLCDARAVNADICTVPADVVAGDGRGSLDQKLAVRQDPALLKIGAQRLPGQDSNAITSDPWLMRDPVKSCRRACRQIPHKPG